MAAIRADGGQAAAIQADVAAEAEVAQLFARTEHERGAPAALVNNAGMTGRIAASEPGRPERVAPAIPMGRLATPDEIAEAVLWITGTTLRCAGGL